MATVTALLTAEEFAQLPTEQTIRQELVRGVVVPMNLPRFRHGEVCLAVGSILREYTRTHKLGRVVSNDSGVITERNPDTVRGPDIAYFSYARLPREVEVELCPPVASELVFEVRSPDDRWSEIHRKVAEYLNVGVMVVGVVDYEARTVSLFYADKPSRTLGDQETLASPEVLGDFSVPVVQLFE